MFIKDSRIDVILTQVYVNDIIFGYTNEYLSKDFADIMSKKFEMSMTGELALFLGLQNESSSVRVNI